MISDPLDYGDWYDLESEEDLHNLAEGREIINPKSFRGPGKYYCCLYAKPYPCGCCQEDVLELMDAEEVILECEMKLDRVKSTYQPIIEAAREVIRCHGRT